MLDTGSPRRWVPPTAGAALLLWALSCSTGRAETVTRVAPFGESLELQYPDGSTDEISIHRSGSVRYFSAGIGIEERNAVYPVVSLKVIFVSGERALLSRVGVTIVNGAGDTMATIPAEQVRGPWLFLDLPPGTYTVIGHRQGRADIARRVEVSSEFQTELILQWKSEDPSG